MPHISIQHMVLVVAGIRHLQGFQETLASADSAQDLGSDSASKISSFLHATHIAFSRSAMPQRFDSTTSVMEVPRIVP